MIAEKILIINNFDIAGSLMSVNNGQDKMKW